jgi:hypothetical protein
MFLSRMVHSFPRRAAPWAVAAAALALGAGEAAAQYRGGPRVPPDARGFQTAQILQRYQRQRAARPATVPPPAVTTAPVYQPAIPTGPLQVVISTPEPAAAPAPFSVAIRGPDGEVRRFPVEGGQAAIRVREITVQPGQQVAITITPTATPTQ